MFEQSHSVYVSLAYRCWNPRWDDARNRQVYGEQASIEGLGGNWRIELKVRSAEKGAFDLGVELADIKGRLDHRALWIDLPEFQDQPSTLEQVTHLLGEWVFARSPQGPYEWVALTIFENERVACTVRPRNALVELRCRVLNFDLRFLGPIAADSGLVISRARITHEAMGLFQETQNEGDEQELTSWARGLFQRLKNKLDNLVGLRIDLPRQQAIEITADT